MKLTREDRKKKWRDNNKELVKKYNDIHSKLRKNCLIDKRKKEINYDNFIWTTIPNFNNELEININGDIVETNNFKLKKLYKDSNGYIQFTHKGKFYLHHRVVSITFIPNPENKSDVNHIDGNRSNNSISNLQWTTHSENIIHSFQHLGRKSNLIKWNKK